MTTYGQFCPVAKAMEVLDERWTLLVVRELIAGSTHFNELRRGNPRMSPALLSRRLRTLERFGILRREVTDGRTSYHLTESGQELRPIVEGLGAWGIRWIGELGEEDLDPHLLLWDIRRTVPVERWPADARTVVEVRFTDQPTATSRWWVCVCDDDVDVCDVDPGYDVTATLVTSLSTLTAVWRADQSWPEALRSGLVRVEAPTEVRRQLPGWFGHMPLGAVPRPAAPEQEPAQV